jgi:opacity protein-like surface antigen
MTIGAALLACLLALGACAAQVQVRQQDMAVTFSEGRFQLTWETAQTKKGSPLIAGYVQNTRGSGVANLRLQVDTLDVQGQVIATATALAPGYVGGFSRTSFEVPLEKTGIGYRVSIIGWDPTGNGQ